MSLVDIALLAVIAAALVRAAAVCVRKKKHCGTCCGDCTKCGGCTR